MKQDNATKSAAGKSDGASGSWNHAVVIGGSMAGLLAGRVLADRFERVTIIERDRYPEGPKPRRGLPQSPHLHILLARGRMILEELFPGLQEELIAAGAPFLDMGADVAWLGPDGWGVRFPSGFKILALSRDLLDWHVRRRLAAVAGLSLLEGGYVTGLLSNSDGARVAGVSVRIGDREAKGGTREERLDADLVIDASGRSSQAPKWLEDLGYLPPKETTVNAYPGYATRIYRAPSEFQADWKGVFMQASPPTRMRMGVLYPIEGNRWTVGLCGVAPDYPPKDEAGFLEFARSLPSPEIYNAIENALPLSPIFNYRPSGNCWRHYEQLSRQPENFLAMGDAVCTFSPVYGQGMTVAALGAIALQEHLDEQSQDRRGNFPFLARRFQKKLSQVNSLPWLSATGQDLRYPGVQGKTSSYGDKLMQGYMDGVVRLAAKNPDICLEFFKVMHMLESPNVLFQPGIALRVLKQKLSLSASL